MCLFGEWGMLEEVSQDFSFFLVQVCGVFPKGIEAAVEFLILRFREHLLQTLKFHFPHLVCRFSIMLGDMETVCHKAGCWDFFSHCLGIGFPQITADGLYCLENARRNRAQKLHHLGFFMPRQNTQQNDLTCCQFVALLPLPLFRMAILL